MKFFFDNNLSSHLVEGLQAFGERVEHLTEHFQGDTSDTIWLPYVGSKQLVLISRDTQLRWNPAEIQAIRDNRVGAFIMTGKSLTHCQIVQQLIRNWPQIKAIATRSAKRTPYIYRIPPSGTTITAYTI